MSDRTKIATGLIMALYVPDMQYLKSASVIEPLKYRFGFKFPPYKFMTAPLKHVSGIQMQLAILQAFYASALLAISDKHIDGGITIDDCFEGEVTNTNVKYVKPLRVDEQAELEVRIFHYGRDVMVGRKYHKRYMRIIFDGFVRGEAEAIF